MRRNRKQNKGPLPTVSLTIEKLVHGGQGMARLDNGRVVFVWNALPGEQVVAQLTRSKKDFAEGFAVEILQPNPDRIATLLMDDVALSTQPWSIMSYESELVAKAEITSEAFRREGVELDIKDVHTSDAIDGYRNKVEFSFFGDDQGVHYAHFIRASHKKAILEYPYNNLIFDQMATRARELLQALNELQIRAGDLKSVILRSESPGAKNSAVAMALFVKTKDFPRIDIPNLAVYYSNPKSPASVASELIYMNGTTTLSDEVRGVTLRYDVLSFFQVNLPVFEIALGHIYEELKNKPSIDMYSGVGSIGLTVGDKVRALIESDPANIALAMENAHGRGIEVLHAPSEKALEHITGDEVVIVDPPRAGLHPDVVAKLGDVQPPKVIYLSCNPSTQARDVRKLIDAGYVVARAECYNFFPRTPHIESLVVLERGTKSRHTV